MHRYVLVALLLLGCATASAQDWVEVKSPHFSVITDAGEVRGRDIAQRFEEMRASFGVLFGRSRVNISAPLTILAFRNTKDFQTFVPRVNGKPIGWTGFFRGGDDHNFIALDTSAGNSFEVVFHEYAHLLINGNFPPMPVWFDEGFAEYCSSLRITGKQIEYAQSVTERLRAAGLRVELDARSEKISFKIREAQLQKIPYMLVVGAREVEKQMVAVRHRKDGDQGAKTLEEFLSEAQKLIDSKN